VRGERDGGAGRQRGEKETCFVVKQI